MAGPEPACPSCGRTGLHAPGCALLARQVRSAVRWAAVLLVPALLVIALVRGDGSAVTAIAAVVASPMGAGLLIGVVAVWVWANRRTSKGSRGPTRPP